MWHTCCIYYSCRVDPLLLTGSVQRLLAATHAEGQFLCPPERRGLKNISTMPFLFFIPIKHILLVDQLP